MANSYTFLPLPILFLNPLWNSVKFSLKTMWREIYSNPTKTNALILVKEDYRGCTFWLFQSCLHHRMYSNWYWLRNNEKKGERPLNIGCPLKEHLLDTVPRQSTLSRIALRWVHVSLIFNFILNLIHFCCCHFASIYWETVYMIVFIYIKWVG